VEFRILGPLEVEDDGRVLALGGAKQRALLAFLVLHANEAVSRDRLIDELWPESAPETAATAVQVYVSHLRKALGRDVIVTQAPGYLIRVEDGELDLARFEQLATRARTETPAHAADTLRAALSLWRGPALTELGASFARPERAHLEEQRLAALEHRIDADLELGRHGQLVPELERLVYEHPLRERLRGQLMLALYRSGRQAEALDVYRSGRRLLDDELGLEPGAELRRLERAILEQDPALATPHAELTEVTTSDGPAPTDALAVPIEKERGQRGPRRSRVAVAAGALVLAGAAAALAVALVRGGSTPSVTVLPNSVAVVDSARRRVIADVSIGGRPVALAAARDAVWVADADDGTVSRIDPTSYRVVKTIGLGADVNDIAVGFGSVWVAGGNDEKLFRIDPRLNALRSTLALGKADPLRPRPVFFVEAGSKGIWITHGDTLLRIDPVTTQVTARVRLPSAPSDVGAGGGEVWVTTADEHLIRIDEGSATISATEPLPSSGVSPTVTHGALWLIVYTASPQLWSLSPSTLVQRSAVPFPPSYPFALAEGNGLLSAIEHDRGLVWNVDTTTGRLTRITRLAYHPISVAVRNRAVWVGVQARPIR
jgi:DNA-binding SARP family transcriptional activator/streptogramin lyase